MEKPKSIAGLKKVLDDLESDYRNWWRDAVKEPVRLYQEKLIAENKLKIESYNEKIKEVKDAIYERKKAAKENKNQFDPKIVQWLNRDFQSGVDFGYGGISLRYVDPKNRYIIVTNNGGTAGTGTAMGTGSYYYAQCDHFVVFPQFGTYLESRLPSHGGRSSNKMFVVEGGRFTNEVKNDMIAKANAYCKQYKVKPFKL